MHEILRKIFPSPRPGTSVNSTLKEAIRLRSIGYDITMIEFNGKVYPIDKEINLDRPLFILEDLIKNV